MAFLKPLNMWGSWWQFLIVFSCTWLLTYGRGQETAEIDNNALLCNDTKMLEECINNLPSLQDHGIPSTPQAVENACKVFDTGMECARNWSKTCLKKQDQEKVTSSVVGALNTYRFLCSDKKFQKDFLQHGDCYNRISPQWDECARKFIESLKRVDHSKDTLGLCCIRYRYIHCVTEVANHFCSKNATRFLRTLAESLVHDSMRTYHLSQCNVGERNCSRASSSASSPSSTNSLFSSSILHTILAYPTKGLVNFLNVLQKLDFRDITTFFCALSREFISYFSYHQSTLNLADNEPESFTTIHSSTTFKYSSRSSDFSNDKEQHKNNRALET